MTAARPGLKKQWLARIAANKAKDYLRSAWVRKMNTPGDDVLALEGAPPGTQPEQQVLETLGEEELTVMILDLREPYRTPCRLVLLEQHTMAEAAQLCGRPPKTVEAQIYRAKKMLAQQILQNYSVNLMERSAYMELFDKKRLPDRRRPTGPGRWTAGWMKRSGWKPPSIYPTAINAWTATPLC